MKKWFPVFILLAMLMVSSAATADAFTDDFDIDPEKELPYEFSYGGAVKRSDGHFYVFGGHNGTNSLDTITHVYLKDGTTASRINDAVLPYPMHSFATIKNGKTVLIAGGASESNRSLSSVISVDLADKDDIQVQQINATLPMGLEGCSGVYINDNYYIFGGYNYSSGNHNRGVIRISNDFSVDYITPVFDFDFLLASVVCDDDYIYILGGTNSVDIYDTIYRFDTQTETAVLLDSALPIPLYSASAIYDGKNIVIMGGITDNNTASDSVILYNIDDGTMAVSADTLPSGRFGSSAVLGEDYILMFGGVNQDGQPLDEIVSLVEQFPEGDLAKSQMCAGVIVGGMFVVMVYSIYAIKKKIKS